MEPQDTQPAVPTRVLVVDDDPSLTTTFAQVLTSAGYLVDVAHDGAAGLTRAPLRPHRWYTSAPLGCDQMSLECSRSYDEPGLLEGARSL